MKKTHSAFPILLTGAILTFAGGFAASYRFDLNASNRYALACLDVFRDAILRSDDLSPMDGARRLENRMGVRAFEVLKDGRTWVSGGRSDLLLRRGFPGRLIGVRTFRVEASDHLPSGTSLDLVMALKTDTGPLGWGLFSSILFLTGALAFRAHDRLNRAPRPPAVGNPGPPPPQRDWIPEALSPMVQEPVMFLDERWTLRFISNGGLKLLKGVPSPIPGQHLLALEPTAQLMEALENGRPGTVFQAFNRFPEISARLEPFPEGGTALFLSLQKGSQSPVNL
jgi:hypothetical protein